MARPYIIYTMLHRYPWAERLTIDAEVIRTAFGVAGDVIESHATYFNETTWKFAFYNTGELCEVSFSDVSAMLCVKCHGVRSKDVLKWLKQYLTNWAKSLGHELELYEEKDNYFYARMYDVEK